MPDFWLNNPAVLFQKDTITALWPRAGMSSDEKLNAITRLVLLMTAVGYVVSRRGRIVVTGAVTVGCIVLLRWFQRRQAVLDTVGKAGQEGFISPAVYEMTRDRYTTPSEPNPAMNVLLTEIKDNPTRKPAAPAFNPQVEKEMNAATQDFVIDSFEGAPDKEKLRDKLFKDLGDSFNFDQSMRSWYATANTQIPNNQKAFAEYCYGDMISCKEGNGLACERNAPPRWTNN